jgi:succinate dehydrogenase / fumarate reductase flavoprotein subunit
MPGVESSDPQERRRLAEAWCDRFEANNRKYLKSTIATLDEDGEVQIDYEEVDTLGIPPRPRLYGLVGAEIIEQVWQERSSEVEAAEPESATPRVVRTVS